jgi:AcrR family transcriptional regulator
VTEAPHPTGRESTRAKILATALRLFGERGFEGTTMREIADACEVTERTVYRYFPFKDDLVLAEMRALTPVLRDLTAARPADERPFTAVQRALKELQSERPSVMALLVRDMGERLLDKSSPALQRIAEEFSEAIAAGLLPRVTACRRPHEHTSRDAPGSAQQPDLLYRARVLAHAAITPLMAALKASVELPVERRSAQNLDALLDEAYEALQSG